MKAAKWFRTQTRVQKRMILETVGLNYELKSRGLLYNLKNPFRILAVTGGSSLWSACVDDVRTWIRDTTEYFALPDLSLKDHVFTVPQVAAA